MNPVIIIPSYWASTEAGPQAGELGTYDHATEIGTPYPELATCLESLEQVRGVMRVCVLLVAPPADELAARAEVEAICAEHPELNPMVVGSPEAVVIQDALAAAVPEMPIEAVSLRGYGAIKNMGLAVAAVLGHDVVVFLDDDEVVLSEDFLIDAVYGLGQMTRQDLPVVAKTGFFLNMHDSPYAMSDTPTAWYDRWWNKRTLFNDWMEMALNGTRISRSNIMCGGCFALHAEAYTRIAFDPYITRGEDLDYLINLRMYGLDVWFDNDWYVAHRPPNTPSRAARFEQDVYRWYYQAQKLAITNGKIDLRQVTPASLMPYPGPWISSELPGRVAKTAFFRALFYPEHGVYWHIFTSGRREARAYAEAHSDSYLRFQTFWPQAMVELWNNDSVADDVFNAADPAWQAEQEALRAERREQLAFAREEQDAQQMAQESLGDTGAGYNMGLMADYEAYDAEMPPAQNRPQTLKTLPAIESENPKDDLATPAPVERKKQVPQRIRVNPSLVAAQRRAKANRTRSESEAAVMAFLAEVKTNEQGETLLPDTVDLADTEQALADAELATVEATVSTAESETAAPELEIGDAPEPEITSEAAPEPESEADTESEAAAASAAPSDAAEPSLDDAPGNASASPAPTAAEAASDAEPLSEASAAAEDAAANTPAAQPAPEPAPAPAEPVAPAAPIDPDATVMVSAAVLFGDEDYPEVGASSESLAAAAAKKDDTAPHSAAALDFLAEAAAERTKAAPVAEVFQDSADSTASSANDDALGTASTEPADVPEPLIEYASSAPEFEDEYEYEPAGAPSADADLAPESEGYELIVDEPAAPSEPAPQLDEVIIEYDPSVGIEIGQYSSLVDSSEIGFEPPAFVMSDIPVPDKAQLEAERLEKPERDPDSGVPSFLRGGAAGSARQQGSGRGGRNQSTLRHQLTDPVDPDLAPSVRPVSRRRGSE